MSNNLQLDAMLKVIDKGIELMPRINQYPLPQAKDLLNSWQEYAKSVVKFVSDAYGKNIYLDYLDLMIKLTPYPPYEQIKQSISWLMELSKFLANNRR